MKTVSFACLVAITLVFGHLRLTAAEGAKLRFLASVYSDANGGGFSLPEAVACGANGSFAVGDTGNNRLLRFTYVDKTVRGGDEIKIPQLSAPVRIHMTSTGQILALDSVQRRIVQFGPEGEFKAVLAFDGVPAPATIVPRSFTIDSADNVYVLDVFSARVLVLDAQGRFQRVLPLPDGIGFGTDLSVDAGGTVYLLDSIRRRLFSAARGANVFTPLGGDLNESVGTLPTSITTSKGIIFVVEGSGSSIVSFGRDGSFLSRQLTMGWEEAALNHPSQMCINDKDEVFIADRDNSRIQVFQLMR